MEVAVVGAHGQIARLLTPLLAERGYRVRGIVRNPDHIEEVEADGAGSVVVCDLERARVDAVAAAIDGCDGVVFAAGAGPGSGTARKASMDRDGALLLVEACRVAGVRRYVMVSAVGADAPPDGEDVFSVYLRAKAEADEGLMASGLEWTVVRPGRLTDGPATGTVRVVEHPERGSVSRADVAAVLADVLTGDGAVGAVLYVND